ncbi:DUF7504 family protein [Halobaculum magnesiiphilum]|uniref:DUF7344 domain-containing protein n=1 Tax=Halobaculum magnesiiphilum TaxID=1017351 RepID=A0A8T8W9B2_9EURY|nr:hypothetical protein [Halobaculum magnesiiphilum]QZP36439.1 hypothetical protein K6T50_08840 [Halobaculum magnesiiphilum]
MTGINGSVAESIGDASTVLLVAPADSCTDETACTELLTRHSPPHPNVICVTLNKGPDDRLDVWHRYVGEELPDRAAILDARREGSGEGATAVSSVPSIKLETLPEDAELLDLTATIAAQVGAWSDTDHRTQLCLDSLNVLVDRYAAQDVVDLVRGLNTLCADLDVSAHHHVNPDDCPESMLAMLRPLYDAVVERDGDGWTVSTADSSADPSAGPSFRRTVDGRSGGSSRDSDPQDIVPLPYSFDTVLELVNNPIRRIVLYELKCRSGDEISFDELVDAVGKRSGSVHAGKPDGTERLALQLRHTHLPKLQERNVVRFDRHTGTVSYRSNPALEAHLECLKTLELGRDPCRG